MPSGEPSGLGSVASKREHLWSAYDLAAHCNRFLGGGYPFSRRPSQSAFVSYRRFRSLADEHHAHAVGNCESVEPMPFHLVERIADVFGERLSFVNLHNN